MDAMQKWIMGINLDGKRRWLRPNAKSKTVVAGICVGGQMEWVGADTGRGEIIVPARVAGDPKKWKGAPDQMAQVAERQLARFVSAARAGYAYH